MNEQFKASTDIQELIGSGLEFLLDAEGNVRIKFINGHIMTGLPVGNIEDTLVTED